MGAADNVSCPPQFTFTHSSHCKQACENLSLCLATLFFHSLETLCTFCRVCTVSILDAVTGTHRCRMQAFALALLAVSAANSDQLASDNCSKTLSRMAAIAPDASGSAAAHAADGHKDDKNKVALITVRHSENGMRLLLYHFVAFVGYHRPGWLVFGGIAAGEGA